VLVVGSCATDQSGASRQCAAGFLDTSTGALSTQAGKGPHVLALSPKISAMLDNSGAGVTQHKLAGGGYEADLGGAFSHVMTATVLPDGRVVTRCVNGSSVDHSATRSPSIRESAADDSSENANEGNEDNGR